MFYKLYNLLMVGVYTDCKHQEFKAGRGYHTICTGCNWEAPRGVTQ